MASITLSPTGDTQIKNDATTTNYGNTDNIDVGEYNAGTQVSRSLIKFDLSSIPAGSTFTSATLRLYDRNTDLSSNARTMRAFRVLRAWVEGDGGVASGATWLSYDGISLWTGAGCADTTSDREATDIGSVGMGTNPADAYVEITLTASEVQEWLDGGLANNGLLLKNDTESDDMHRLGSREMAGTTQDPELVIVYTAPASGGGIFMDTNTRFMG